MKDEKVEERQKNMEQEQQENQQEKTDCIIDPKQQELDELNDRYKREIGRAHV